MKKNKENSGADAPKKDAGDNPFLIDVSDTTRKGYTYTMKKIWVNENTIDQIRLLKQPFGHARKIRRGQVNKLKQLLQDGKHFESPLVFEKINGYVGDSGFRCIDGGHRWTSIKEWLTEVPKGSKVSFFASIYQFNGMNDEEKKHARREIYRKWNVGTKQSTDDFIQSYQDEIPMFERIAEKKKKIPCTVYGTPGNNGDTLKFKDFVGGYLASVKKGDFQGGYSGSAQKFVDDCKNRPLSETDVKNIEYFWNTLCLAYDITTPYVLKGQATTVQQYIVRTTPFYAIMRLILQNKDRLSDEEIIQRLQRDTIKETIQTFSKLGGREACKKCHELLTIRINAGYGDDIKKQFKPIMKKEDKEETERKAKEFLRSMGIVQEEDTEEQENLEIEEVDLDEEELKEKDGGN
jgi:hypothetical protein